MKRKSIIFALALGMVLLCSILPQRVSAAAKGEISMNAAPSVVAEAASYAELDAALEYADVLLFSVDKEGAARFTDGTACSLKDLYVRCEEVVPAARVQTQEEAEALAAFLLESGAEDFFVVSDSAQLIGAVKSQYAVVRGVYDAREKELSGDGAGYALAGETCAAQAQVVLLGEGVSREVTEQVQSRSVLVWVCADDSAQSLWAAATVGCFGIVSGNPAAAVQVLSQMDGDALARPAYLAGHRGDTESYNENSAEGVKGAFRAGATHAEIDLRLTADGQIVIMHDATIDRTTNGTGTVSQMTLEEIRQYKIIDNIMLAGQSEIPTAEDMLKILCEEEFADKLLILEIKDDSVPLLEKIGELLARHPQVRDRLLFITFYEGLLSELAERFPDIPRGFLDSLSAADFLQRMSPVNAFIDNNVASVLASVANAEMLRDYGYSVWAWTYGDAGSLVSGMHAGFLGLTANKPGELASYIREISAPQTLSAKEAKDGYMVTATLFDGTQVQVEAKWVAISKNAGVFLVKYEDEDNFLSLSYYTQPVSVNGGGCSGEAAGGMLAVSVVVCLAAAALILESKK